MQAPLLLFYFQVIKHQYSDKGLNEKYWPTSNTKMSTFLSIHSDGYVLSYLDMDVWKYELAFLVQSNDPSYVILLKTKMHIQILRVGQLLLWILIKNLSSI